MFLQFLGALVGASFVVSVASLVWPRVSQKPRPQQLEKVREIVIQTTFGKQADEFLGNINVSSVASSLAQSAGNAVSQKVTEEVTNRAVSQIISQIDKLPDTQRQVLEDAVCKK